MDDANDANDAEADSWEDLFSVSEVSTASLLEKLGIGEEDLSDGEGSACPEGVRHGEEVDGADEALVRLRRQEERPPNQRRHRKALQDSAVSVATTPDLVLLYAKHAASTGEFMERVKTLHAMRCTCASWKEVLEKNSEELFLPLCALGAVKCGLWRPIAVDKMNFIALRLDLFPKMQELKGFRASCRDLFRLCRKMRDRFVFISEPQFYNKRTRYPDRKLNQNWLFLPHNYRVSRGKKYPNCDRPYKIVWQDESSMDICEIGESDGVLKSSDWNHPWTQPFEFDIPPFVPPFFRRQRVNWVLGYRCGDEDALPAADARGSARTFDDFVLKLLRASKEEAGNDAWVFSPVDFSGHVTEEQVREIDERGFSPLMATLVFSPFHEINPLPFDDLKTKFVEKNGWERPPIVIRPP